jgi:hypothetical protein
MMSHTRIDLAIADRLGLLAVDRIREKSEDLPIVILSALSFNQAFDKGERVPVGKWIERGFDWPKRVLSLINLHAKTIPQLFENAVLLNCAIVNFGEKQDEGQLIKAVALPWFEILREIERDQQFIFQFCKQPRIFEEFIAGAYERSGWRNIVITPQSADRGRDIILAATLPGVGTIQVVDELKAYSPNRPVTAKEVSRLAWVLQRDRAVSKGIVTTTSTFECWRWSVYRSSDRLFRQRFHVGMGARSKVGVGASIVRSDRLFRQRFFVGMGARSNVGFRAWSLRPCHFLC